MFEYPIPVEAQKRFRLMRTLIVVILLTIAALVFSYLGAFAVSDALMHADLIEPWKPDQDPRLHWMLMSFFLMTGSFLTIGSILKWSSWRQMKTLDAISDVEA